MTPPQKKSKVNGNEGKKADPKGTRSNRSQDDQSGDDLYVIGIGASAGGLEALEGLFQAMPTNTGAAFVIIQHLASDQKSFTPELLGKHTDMPIVTVEQETALEPNTIYLRTPQQSVTIAAGRLRPVDLEKGHGQHLPIDRFFRDLAEDRQERSIGIILSGAGSDGSLGLKDIHRGGGAIFVQDPEQAEHKGMPSSAIQTDLADFVLPVEQIPHELRFYLKHPFLKISRQQADGKSEKFNRELTKILRILRTQTDRDFSRYKMSTVRRRVQRRMTLQHIENPEDYSAYLKNHREEANALVKDLLINVTNFFRNPEAFETLKQALANYLKQADDEQELRIWCPGCATGEEAYSIAILVHEVFEEQDIERAVRIFATDLNEKTIEYGREATYPENIAGDVGEARLKKFFKRKDGVYKVDSRLREMVVFALHDLTSAPPFSRLDLVSCRNLLIYLDSSLQKQILPLLHYSLREGGLLFLGKSEDVGEFTDLFAAVDKKIKLFRARRANSERMLHELDLEARRPTLKRIQAAPDAGEADAATAGQAPHADEAGKEPGHQADWQAHKGSSQELRAMVERTIMERHSPPGVLVDAQGVIRYFHGDSGRYLSLPQGEPSFNIESMVLGDFQKQVSELLEEARHDNKRIIRRDVSTGRFDESPVVDLVATPVITKNAPHGLILLTFEETETADPDQRVDAQVAALERELQSTRQDLQASIEELESSNEELQSANEELQANNEELQSANEELETSREELQSTNEELEVVNSELEEKNQALMRAKDDVNNLFNATGVGTAILDDQLRIKRFTPEMKNYFKLIEGDVGRPLTDIASNLQYDDLQEDCQQVLDRLEKQIRDVRTKDGSWVQISIHPYRSSENVIAGVVVTCTDQTRIKQSEQKTQHALFFADAILMTTREPLVVLDGKLKVLRANRAFCEILDQPEENLTGQLLYRLNRGLFDIPELRELLEKIIPEKEEIFDYCIEGKRSLVLNARRMVVEEDSEQKILISFEIPEDADRPE